MNCAEDTMLLSHALQPEGLRVWGISGVSIPTKAHGKHMRKKDETIREEPNMKCENCKLDDAKLGSNLCDYCETEFKELHLKD